MIFFVLVFSFVALVFIRLDNSQRNELINIFNDKTGMSIPLYDSTDETAEEESEETNIIKKITKKTTSKNKYEIYANEAYQITDPEIQSTFAILVDADDMVAVAGRDAGLKMYPASMTKVLTVLVAAENINESKLDTDTYTITQEDIEYAYLNGFSAVGWIEGDTPTIRDLFYGTILPSGADAAVGLAKYVAGSHEEFVEMMNDKLKELGISETTHFTNCVGLYEDNHYTTARDMAIIMKAASENDLCREVMSAKTYTTTPTLEEPDGIILSNWFIRKIEDKDTHGTVLYAKTGYVEESGCCAVSYLEGADGKDYICVTGNSTSSWQCIYDHVGIYDAYIDDAE